MEHFQVQEVVVQYRNKELLTKITEPKDVANFFRKILPDNSREHFLAAYLDAAHQITAYSVISTGTANATYANPREIFQRAILNGAIALIVCHNHPTGSLEASREDEAVTHKIKEAGKLLDIKLLDHLIISDDNYFSFSEKGF